MSTSTKSFSASQTAGRFGVHERTARMFMKKIREAMKSREDFPMKGVVNVDEYLVVVKKKASQAGVMIAIRKKRYVL